jgi:hypothetical protein
MSIDAPKPQHDRGKGVYTQRSLSLVLEQLAVGRLLADQILVADQIIEPAFGF